MPVIGSPDNLYVGRECGIPKDIKKTLQFASEAKFDFVVIPLTVSHTLQEAPDKYELEPSTGSDLVLDNKTWSTAIVGMVSSWVDPDAQTDMAKRNLCLQALKSEAMWASHLSVYGVLLPPPSVNCALYAGALNQMILSGFTTTQLMIRMPMIYSDESGKITDGWEVWNKFRLFCDQNAQLEVALEVTADLPETEIELKRWIAEPVRALVIPTDVFVTNNKGFPVLSKRHKAFVTEFFQYRVQIILGGLKEGEEGQAETSQYLNYIARLYQSQEPLSQAEQFAQGYHDFLQAPLQPLQDDLGSQTYETFEKDPVKYVQYEEATFHCISDKIAAGKKSLVLAVVGAGRGPLVQASLNATKRAAATVRILAVEKNQNAIVTLEHKKQTTPGWEGVEIISTDMRLLEGKIGTKVDILVSELLGSFGDNELSPECLDGAQVVLAPDGVSIPRNCRSSLTLVSTTKLWNLVRNFNDITHFETAYVVKFHKAFYPTSAIKDCFTFEHPNFELNTNERYAEICFEAEVDSLIHGFAGYFHCDLYKNEKGTVSISIDPRTFSDGMFSWFPIFFPLRQPVSLKKGQRVRSHWWRCESDSKVWYEWSLSEPVASCVHNPGGRSYNIGK